MTQRTDTEMLGYVLPLVAGSDKDDSRVFQERVQALTAALTLGYAGREAISLAMGAKVFEPGEALPPMSALDLVADELTRIREVEGFTPERDDDYLLEHLARASAVYIAPQRMREHASLLSLVWPWDEAWWKPTPGDRIRELVKGCALAVCEIERLKRKPAEIVGVECERPDDAEPGVCIDAQGLDPIPGDVHFTAHNPIKPEPKVGDTVKMERAAREWEGWVPAMSSLIGGTYTVERLIPAIRTHAAMVQIGGWRVPTACVEVMP